MDDRETSREIERTAAQWVARRDRGRLSSGDAEELERWLAGDARRRGAYLRARALWLRSESASALGPRYDPDEFRTGAQPSPRSGSTRRCLLEWGGAMAASLLVVVLTAMLHLPTAYATVKGEMRLVPLAGGNSMTLNTDSRVEVHDDAGQQRVRVVRGEVLFVVSANANGAVMVEVDGRQVRAAAASFVVRKLPAQATQMVVLQGHAELPGARARLDANTRALLPVGEDAVVDVEAVASDRLARELAWREGKIALQGETLGQAAAEFARYSDTRIVIADPQLAKMQVAGLFASNNPVGFSHAVAEVFDAHVQQAHGSIVIGGAH